MNRPGWGPPLLYRIAIWMTSSFINLWKRKRLIAPFRNKNADLHGSAFSFESFVLLDFIGSGLDACGRIKLLTTAVSRLPKIVMVGDHNGLPAPALSCSGGARLTVYHGTILSA